jgi:hypothetical protein
MSRERRELNTYTRSTNPKNKWEQEFTQGETGGKFDEEYQAEKRIRDRDPEAAEWYKEFNYRYYKDRGASDTDWGKRLRNSRATELYVRGNREIDGVSTRSTILQFPVKRKLSTVYTEDDYQRHMAYDSHFVRHINDKIDTERGLKDLPESGTPGIIYLPIGKSRWGIPANKTRGGWVVSLRVDGEWEREYFESLCDAERYRYTRLEEI